MNLESNMVIFSCDSDKGMGPDSQQMTTHGTTAHGQDFFYGKYILLSVHVALLHVPLLCNYTLDISSYL